MTIEPDEGTVRTTLAVSEVTPLGRAAIVRIAHASDPRAVASLTAVVETLQWTELAVLVADVHDLDQLDAEAARAIGDLARRATEHSTALRVIGDEPAVLIPLLGYAQADELKICDSSGKLQPHFGTVDRSCLQRLYSAGGGVLGGAVNEHNVQESTGCNDDLEDLAIVLEQRRQESPERIEHRPGT